MDALDTSKADASCCIDPSPSLRSREPLPACFRQHEGLAIIVPSGLLTTNFCEDLFRIFGDIPAPMLLATRPRRHRFRQDSVGEFHGSIAKDLAESEKGGLAIREDTWLS